MFRHAVELLAHALPARLLRERVSDIANVDILRRDRERAYGPTCKGVDEVERLTVLRFGDCQMRSPLGRDCGELDIEKRANVGAAVQLSDELRIELRHREVWGNALKLRLAQLPEVVNTRRLYVDWLKLG